MTTNAILRFFGTDPLVAVTLTFGAVSVIAFLIWAVLLRHEERKAEHRKDLDRMLEAAHRVPSPFTQPAAQGGEWQKTRRPA